MSGSRRWVSAVGAGLLVVLAGCSSGGTGGGQSITPGGDGGASAPAGGGPSAAAGGGGGNVGGVDACALLTTDEIKSALGVDMAQDTAKGSDCTWDAVDSSKGLSVEVEVSKFDQDLWNGETNLSNETKVDGVGDEAWRGFVSDGVLLIHKGGAEIDLTIVALFTDQPTINAAQVTLGKLIVARL